MRVHPVRVIVTANDERGKSYIDFDGDAEGAVKQPNRPTALTDLWHMSGVPVDPRSDGLPLADRPFTLSPQDNGVAFRVVQFDPMSEADWAAVDASEVFAAMNAADEHVGGEVSPVMHRTRSVDFGIVLAGSLTMLLDDATVVVSQGDIIVQRATNHAWENRGTETAIVAFILVDARDHA